MHMHVWYRKATMIKHRLVEHRLLLSCDGKTSRRLHGIEQAGHIRTDASLHEEKGAVEYDDILNPRGNQSPKPHKTLRMTLKSGIKG